MQTATAKIEAATGINCQDFADYHDGFRVTVAAEIEAYKLAHAYQHGHTARIAFSNGIGRWTISLYKRTA